MVIIYNWFQQALREQFAEIRLLKESSRGNVRLIRHKATGQKFILRHYQGNVDVYQKLLQITCKNLPTIFEVASQGDEILVLDDGQIVQRGTHSQLMAREGLYQAFVSGRKESGQWKL